MWLLNKIAEAGHKPAITDSVGVYNYFDLLSQIDKYGSQLATKNLSGSVVAILSDYNFYTIALFLELIRRGCIIVPIVGNNANEIIKRLEIARVDITISLNPNGSLILSQGPGGDKHPLVETLSSKNISGLILFSSGSTGQPKAMIHDVNNLINKFQGKKSKNLTILVFLMFDHIGGLNTLFNMIAMEAHIIIPSDRKPETIAFLIDKHQIHLLPTSPTFLNLMLMSNIDKSYDLSSIKMITYGTEPMPDSLLKKLRIRFPRVRFLQTFGTSETGIAQTVSRSSDSLEMKLDDPDCEYKVLNGELLLRSKTQVLGYLNASMESFTEDGWFRTGDLVEVIDDGYIRIIGRSNEIINVGGEKVLPQEIESVLMEIPEIVDVLVRGELNIITGQTVVADIVVLGQFDQKEFKSRLRKHCLNRLARYKMPTKINFIDQVNTSSRFKKKRNT